MGWGSWQGGWGTYPAPKPGKRACVWQNNRISVDPVRNSMIRTTSSRLLKVTENLRKRLKWNPSEVQTKEKGAVPDESSRTELLCPRSDSPTPFHPQAGLSDPRGWDCSALKITAGAERKSPNRALCSSAGQTCELLQSLSRFWSDTRQRIPGDGDPGKHPLL